MTYQELRKAMEFFRLGERASMEQIRTRHRELVKTHHPDHDKETGPELIKEVNQAYEVIMNYCNSYNFCFSEDEFFEQRPDEQLKRQFGWI